MTEVVSEFEKISQERKEMVTKGEVPEWYITQGYLMFKRKYAYKGETVRGCFRRVASTLAKHIDHIVPDAEDKFFDLLWSGKLAGSTPVLSNTGTERGDPVSCSGGYVNDSIDGFFSHIREVALLSKYGYGCSGYWGDVRERGAEVSSGGKADGPVGFVDLVFGTVSEVKQGDNRRGNYAAYFEVDTPDFKEVVGYVHKNKGFANVGWNFRDNFIERLKVNDRDAVDRWNDVLYTRAADSKGYIAKPDHANRLAPQAIKNSGISIKGSNLCVAPETMIMTNLGCEPIHRLKDQQVSIWNGEEFSQVTVRLTGKNQNLIKITVGGPGGYQSSIECTPYHKFYDKEGKEIRAGDLVEGTELLEWVGPDGYKVSDKVISVLDEGRVDDTYCFTEHKRNMGVFNGILTGNCNEVQLPQDEEHTFSCVLSSLNLAKWDDITDDDIFWSVVFLDCVVEEMLTKARNRPGFEKIVRFTEKSRALGQK